MPAISCEDFVPWVNYHLSVGEPKGQDFEPQLQVERLARVHASDLEGLGPERFALTARMFSDHLEVVRRLMCYKLQLNQLGTPPQPFPLALTGRGWSFSDLVGAKAGEPCPAMLALDGLSGAVLLGEEDEGANFSETPIALVSGGTRLRELAELADRRGLSILDSGTHLGATMAGVMGTASHGSRLGHGGLQEMVHGLHLVTGIGEAVWIERGSRPLLSDDQVAKLTPAGWQTRTIRCDQTFEDALVHLGCLGIVNAVAVELAPKSWFKAARLDRRIDSHWLQGLAKGDWQMVGQVFSEEAAPVFYELTLDPHGWDGESALHTAYFSAGAHLAPVPVRPFTALGDAIAAIGRDGLLQAGGNTGRGPSSAGFIERPVPMAYFFGSAKATSVFDHYRCIGQFESPGNSITGAWKDLHPDEITGGYPGALWNASWAIPRADLPKAIPAIAAAIRDLPRSFVFTVRFVTNASGTLAFTRFPEAAVIEIDGLSPWICRKVAQRWINYMGGKTDGIAHILQLLRAIEPVLPEGGRRVSEALHRAGIDFSMHWAKLGEISPAAVQAAFGDPADPGSKLGRWRATREKLLASDFARAIFWNWGAVRMGLLDRPDRIPSDVCDPPKTDC